MSPRRSIFLGTTLLAPGRGGIARVARMTARALVEAGLEIELLSLLDRHPVEIAGARARLAHGSKLRYLLLCRTMASRSYAAIYDAVGMARAHPQLWSRHIPYATWMHGIEAWYGLHPRRRRALFNADLVLANSNFTLQKFETLHRRLPVARVCWLGTEDDDPPMHRPTFEGRPIVLCLGRIEADQGYKGHRELITIWPKITSKVPRARLVIAGGGSGLRTISDLARSSPAAATIDVLGFVSEAHIESLWKAAHLFTMPSRNEGFGIVYAEAMRWGLPVIASTHDAGSEVNIDGVTGFNANLDKRDDLADRLISLLTNTSTAATFGAAGHERWRQHFRFSAFAGRLQQSLAGFVGNQPSLAA